MGYLLIDLFVEFPDRYSLLQKIWLLRPNENLDSANVELTDEEFTALEDALNGLKVYGHRGLGGF